jgi:hypothetical protein
MSSLIVVSPSAALEWGWSIFPCGLNKRPIIDSWKPYQTERATREQVAEWQRLNPPLWALITGAISDRITLDFDGESGRRTIEHLAIEPHRSTPSGGFHADFVYPGWKVPTLNGKSKRDLGARWPGLDIRADGGYAVFTGRTPRGEYHWLRGPAAYPLDVLPEDLREFLGLTRASEPSPKGDGRESISAQHVEPERLVRMALERSSNDGRNNSGLWLACQLRDNGYSEAEAKSVMRAYSGRLSAFNTKGEREAYDEREASSTLREAFSRPARQPWTSGVLNRHLKPVKHWTMNPTC